MIKADGTKDKSNLGANAILAVSIACCHAAAEALGIPLYRFLGGVGGTRLPVPMMNILNGGAHAANTVDVQEFMIMPAGACCFKEGLRMCTEVFHSLQSLLKSRGLATAVGDEGGFAPDLSSDEEAIQVILEAVEKAGYRPGSDFVLAIDAASSEWKTGVKGQYRLPKSGQTFTSAELTAHWKALCDKYPIYSIEDGLDEEDWEGWQMLTKELGGKVQLVGDDLFVTNTERLKKGIELAAETRSSSSSTRSVRSPRPSKRSAWPTAPVTPPSSPTARAKRRIRPFRTWRSRSTPARSRPAPPAAANGSPNTTSCSGLRNPSGKAPSIPALMPLR